MERTFKKVTPRVVPKFPKFLPQILNPWTTSSASNLDDSHEDSDVSDCCMTLLTKEDYESTSLEIEKEVDEITLQDMRQISFAKKEKEAKELEKAKQDLRKPSSLANQEFLGATLHNQPLYVTGMVVDICVSRFMLDYGSAVNPKEENLKVSNKKRTFKYIPKSR
ncbi:hypothetical protein G4B88_012807 [Cannabis sativa]|uniref:Uncharacterized protein n=1 Tax=Cannabis sativa TaxID=3483 RepID=A0A7J6F6K0_CANSA|nr:hypothetical protein G4B88_012807 [Cannabis sativa]